MKAPRVVPDPVYEQLPRELQHAACWAPVDSTAPAGSPGAGLQRYDALRLASDAASLVRAEHLPPAPHQGLFLVPGERSTAEVRHQTERCRVRVRIDLSVLVEATPGPLPDSTRLLSKALLETRAGAPLEPEEVRQVEGGGTVLRYPTPPPFHGMRDGLFVYAEPRLLLLALPVLVDLRPNPLAE